MIQKMSTVPAVDANNDKVSPNVIQSENEMSKSPLNFEIQLLYQVHLFLFLPTNIKNL